MKSSDILLLSRALIATGERRFVCEAIMQVIGGEEHPVLTAIRKSMRGYVYINNWLSQHSLEYREFYREYANCKITSEEYNAALKKYRLRWIDWMIEGYKRVGD